MTNSVGWICFVKQAIFPFTAGMAMWVAVKKPT